MFGSTSGALVDTRHLLLQNNKKVEERCDHMAASHDFLADLHWCVLLWPSCPLDIKNIGRSHFSHIIFDSQDHVGVQLRLLDKDGSRPSAAQGPKRANQTNYPRNREVQENWTGREDGAGLLPHQLFHLLHHSLHHIRPRLLQAADQLQLRRIPATIHRDFQLANAAGQSPLQKLLQAAKWSEVPVHAHQVGSHRLLFGNGAEQRHENHTKQHGTAHYLLAVIPSDSHCLRAIYLLRLDSFLPVSGRCRQPWLILHRQVKFKWGSPLFWRECRTIAGTWFIKIWIGEQGALEWK